jgi:hypothetical protein
MIEIEKYPCNDRLESNKRERYWIEILNATLNKVIPSRTYKEYYEVNKSKIEEKRKVQKKEYYKDNKPKILERQKTYYENNRTNISEKGKTKTNCDICNCIIVKRHIQIHNKSIKHQNNLLINQQENDNN